MKITKVLFMCIPALVGTLSMQPIFAGAIDCSTLNYANAPSSSDTCLSLGSADPYNALFRQGTSNIGVLFLHGRGQNPNGDVVRQLRNSLNADGYTTLAIENPVPANGNTSFTNYVVNEDIIDNQVFSRVEVAVSELKNRNVDRIVLAGFSLGGRFATASAAAWEQNLLNTSGLDLIGLLGVGLYTSGPDSTLTNINVLNTVSNLSFITSIPVLDIYGNNDNPASGTADARRNAYQGDNYTQEALICPDNNGQYFAQVGLGFQPYYGNGAGDVNRCHQLRNGFLQDASNNFFPDVVLRGSPDAPLESVVRDWFSLNFVAIPEPETFLLLLIGLIGMRFIRRKRSKCALLTPPFKGFEPL